MLTIYRERAGRLAPYRFWFWNDGRREAVSARYVDMQLVRGKARLVSEASGNVLAATYETEELRPPSEV